MAQVFLGSLLCVPYNFPPKGWAFCQGQLLSISQNTALFSLLGTFYGGDGKTTFGLPNLSASVAIGQGQGPGLQAYSIGEQGGTPSVTLITGETPPHTHAFMVAKIASDQSAPNQNGLSLSASNVYSNSTQNLTQLNPQVVSVFGSSLPHNNLMPYQGLNWVIALQGIYPPDRKSVV